MLVICIYIYLFKEIHTIAKIPICCDGFEYFNKTCVYKCDPKCINGHCVKTNVCECLEGYAKNATLSSICHPLCTKACENGYCSRPNTCNCNDGYELSHVAQLCVPKCRKKCMNATCTSPDLCRCDESWFEIQCNNLSLAFTYNFCF